MMKLPYAHFNVLDPERLSDSIDSQEIDVLIWIHAIKEFSIA